MTGNEFDRNDHDVGGAPDAGSDETAMPLGIGGMDDDGSFDTGDPFAGMDEPGKRSINSGAVLLAAVVLIAAAGLFSMRTLTRATAAGDTPTDAEQSIESFLAMLQSSKAGEEPGEQFQLGADEIAVLDILNESYASRQVALTHVQRNPFIIFEPTANVPDAPTRPQGQDPRERKRQDRRAQFEQASGRLELRSVLMGNPPLATINNNIVQVGATVIAEPENVAFRVASISNDGVVIVAEDAELDVTHEATLTIDRERMRRGSPPRSNQRGPVRPR